MANQYKPNVSWGGKPPIGHHLDVIEDDTVIQKLMIDDKDYYLFGQDKEINDFCNDHASCSRIHAAIVYHKNLKRSYLVDLGSTHGTFIGTLRLQPLKPTRLQINSLFHFGSSPRYYILRERPSAGRTRSDNIMEISTLSKSGDEAPISLPGTSETDLDKSTEYNTAITRISLSWSCEICGLVIKSKKANLDRHKLLHGPLVERLKCSICGRKCSNKYNFEKHWQRFHRNEPVPKANPAFDCAKDLQLLDTFDLLENSNCNQPLLLNGASYRSFLNYSLKNKSNN